MIVLQLTKVERNKRERPKGCPYCGGEILRRWGQSKREIKDTKIRTVKVHRLKCTKCGRTFRHYPDGISHTQQSEWMKQLAVIC